RSRVFLAPPASRGGRVLERAPPRRSRARPRPPPRRLPTRPAIMTPWVRARRLSGRRVYDGKVLALDVDEVEEPGDVRAVREVVRHRGSVAALPVQADGRVVLVRQYRYAVDSEVWELPAGRLDPGETPETGARREMEEEVGLRAEALEPLVTLFPTPGFCAQKV